MLERRALLVDDEAIVRRALQAALAELWPELVICGEAASGEEALRKIEGERPHIVFLDIHMPGMSGLQVAAKMPAGCQVVFVTAYDQHAVEAFEKNAVDYLLKPVRRERLLKTVERLQKSSAGMQIDPEMLTKLALLASERSKETLQWLRVQQGEGVRLIAVGEVCFFQAADKYTRVVAGQGEWLIRKSIADLEKELNPQIFWRIHRATIVNAGCIEKTSKSITGRYLLHLFDRDETLTVSRSYSHLFKQM